MSRSAALLQAALRRPIEDVLSRCKLSSKSPAVTTLTGMMREAAPLILAKWPACRHQAHRPPAHICLPPSHHPHPSTTSAQCGATVTPLCGATLSASHCPHPAPPPPPARRRGLAVRHAFL